MKTKVLILAVSFLFSFSISITSSHAAPVDKQIYYTKKTTLTYPKTYTIRFSLWDAATSGNMVWSEEESVQLKTSSKITNYLGDTTALDAVDFSEQLWVQVDRVKTGPIYVPIGTRTKLGVVPYALAPVAVPLSLSGSVAGGIITGINTYSSGFGVYGVSYGSPGYGVYGQASGAGTSIGGYFTTEGNTGRGVVGGASAPGAFTNYGGYFSAAGNTGRGVYGAASGSSGRGVYGYASGASGYGVYGYGAVSPTSYDFYAGGPGVDYGTSSSIRWKRNIVEIENALGKIMNLRGVYFDWDEEHGGRHDMGFIAEEVGKVVPEVVGFEPDGVYATGVDYGAVTPMLVQAIKEQQAMIDKLKTEIEELKKMIAR